MKRKVFSLLLCGILGFSLVACNNDKELTLYRHTKIDCGFNTICSLNAYTETEEEFNMLFNTMTEDFAYYHKIFDIYNNYEGINNIKTVNDNAGIKPVEVDQALIDLILLSKDINELSNGAFDITNGSLLKVWHNYRDAGLIKNMNGELGDIPELEELELANKHKGFDKVIIDDEKNTVYITDKDVSLDVGGVAKGFTVEIIADHLVELGLKHGAVNGGGNQKIIGTKGDGTGWNIGIQDPRAETTAGVVSEGSIAMFPNQTDVAVVTSGDYQNFYFGEGKRLLAHIIDPDTLYPADHFYGVSVLVEDSGLADCLSTALFVLDYNEGLEFINKVNEAYNLDLKVLWVSGEALDETSIQAKTNTTQYITVTSNASKEVVTK